MEVALPQQATHLLLSVIIELKDLLLLGII
jgi:hypothetical protein